MLTGALEIHYIDMVKFRKLDIADLNNPIHRWLVFFNEHSPVKLLEEAIKMDTAIRTTAERMEMIRRDPDLAHAYDLYEEERIARLMWAQGERREGRWEEKMTIAKALKASGDDANKIALVTGLSLDEIAKL
jgi:predicted transposase/invertase (TIGR01784 family)